MRPEPTFTLAGTDVTDVGYALLPQLQTTIFKNETRPMANVGGGLSVTLARHVTLDVGYTFSGIFIKSDYLQEDPAVSPHTHTRIYTHRGYFGAGYRF
jgi:opacity protein-like surface antigen